MLGARILSLWTASGVSQTWHPTTLKQLDKGEEVLEAAIAATPELLGLESRRTSIRGPYSVFRQLELPTPTGRLIYPDILLLAASGHVIVVEVKRYGNSELRDRSVIAQIVDYASSFAAVAKEEADAVRMLSADRPMPWGDLVEELFPGVEAADELAQTLLERMRSGELNLAIACDKVPPGLPEVVSGIVSQRTLGFELDLVEVTPYVREQDDDGAVLFVPSTRLATEIVARTAVTVTYRQGDQQPSTTVEVSDPEEIAERIEATRSPSKGRRWEVDEAEKEFREHSDPTSLALWEFCKLHSAGGQFLSPRPTLNPSVGFYVDGLREDGRPARVLAFFYTLTWGITIKLSAISTVLETDEMRQLCERLKAIFGTPFDTSLKEPGVSLKTLGPRFEQFKEAMLWVKERAQARGLGDGGAST